MLLSLVLLAGSAGALLFVIAVRPTYAAATVLAALALVASGAFFAHRVRANQRRREQRATAQAVAEERRRMAADVHDLIMQELSFALTNARALLADPKLAPQASVVVAAAERALSAARDVVNNLAERDREPVVEVVEASVRAAARRAQLTFDAARVPPDARPDRPTCDALIHISREAVTNAIKHANPEAIEVVLEYGDEWRLQVHDEGSGFDASHVVPGFGLESMRERAQALGGSLQITSAAGRGTTVEAVLP